MMLVETLMMINKQELIENMKNDFNKIINEISINKFDGLLFIQTKFLVDLLPHLEDLKVEKELIEKYDSLYKGLLYFFIWQIKLYKENNKEENVFSNILKEIEKIVEKNKE